VFVQSANTITGWRFYKRSSFGRLLQFSFSQLVFRSKMFLFELKYCKQFHHCRGLSLVPVICVLMSACVPRLICAYYNYEPLKYMYAVWWVYYAPNTLLRQLNTRTVIQNWAMIMANARRSISSKNTRQLSYQTYS